MAARQWSTERKQSEAEWALLELELSIERRDPHNIQKVLNEIRSSHLQEEGVAEATYRLLHAAGLVNPQQRITPLPAGSPPATGPAPEEQGTTIWTPGDQQTPAEGEKKSAIWTP